MCCDDFCFLSSHQEESSKKGKQQNQKKKKFQFLNPDNTKKVSGFFFFLSSCRVSARRYNRSPSECLVVDLDASWHYFFLSYKSLGRKERKNEKNIKGPSVMFKWIRSLSWCVSLTFFFLGTRLLFRLAISCIMWRDSVCLKRTHKYHEHTGNLIFFFHRLSR